MSNKVPVLFLVFNRPRETLRVLKRILDYGPTRLYVAADGPRDAKLDGEKCKETRRLFDNLGRNIEVVKLFKDENFGCKNAVAGAIDWFFEHEEMGIILEDDCLPTISFFSFTEELLYRYREDTRIGMIGGNNFQCDFESNLSYFYTSYVSIWGWGTWRRAWAMYDKMMERLDAPEVQNTLKYHFNDKEFIERMNNFENARNGKIDTWDYQWHFCCVMNNLLTILPKKNLVSNIGIGENATHTKTSADSNLKSFELKQPLLHPYEIVFNPIYEARFNKAARKSGPESFYECLKNEIKKHIKKNLKRI